jgi:hypothetical protein
MNKIGLAVLWFALLLAGCGALCAGTRAPGRTQAAGSMGRRT